MLKKAEELQNTALKELEDARKEKLFPPEASPQLARETSLPPSQVNPSEAGASASLPSHGPSLKSVISSTALDATHSSQFDPSTEVMLHFVDADSNLPSPVYEPPPPSVVSDSEPIVFEIPVTPEVAISQVFACPTIDINEPPSPPQDQTQGTGTGSSAALSFFAGGEESSPQQGVSTLPGETPGLSQQVPKGTSPPHLVRKSKRSRPHLSSGGTAPSEQIGQTEIAPSAGIAPLEGVAVQNPPPFPSSNPAKLPKLF
ncbi:hypothetical protein ACFX2A_005218 [Malus domestica]